MTGCWSRSARRSARRCATSPATCSTAAFPRGTILVNWVGSFLLGWFTGLGLSGHALALLGTGFCGGLTTYSSFVVQTHDLGPRLGAANVVLTVVPALLLCALGVLGRAPAQA